jgi:hypothetical protein
MIMGTVTGAVLTRACVGRRYEYEMGDPDPEVRPASDAWLIQLAIIAAAGAATGSLIVASTPRCTTPGECVLGGSICALVFAPVCFAVIAAARRAQRARLGSIVAGCDRRAVWGILAMALAVMTIEVAPSWPAYAAGDSPSPAPVLVMLALATLATFAILLADMRAASRARSVVALGLSAHEREAEPAQEELARFDLGVGNDVLSHVERGRAAYRQRTKTVALVKGTPEVALGALRRAVARGKIALAVTGGVGAVHAYAATEPALTTYQSLLCSPSHSLACTLAADRLEQRDPNAARMLRRRARPSGPDFVAP